MRSGDVKYSQVAIKVGWGSTKFKLIVGLEEEQCKTMERRLKGIVSERPFVTV